MNSTTPISSSNRLTKVMSQGKGTSEFGKQSSLVSLGIQVYSCMYCIYTSNSFHHLEKHMAKHSQVEIRKLSENYMPQYVNLPGHSRSQNNPGGGHRNYRKNWQINFQVMKKIYGHLQQFPKGINMESTRKKTMSQIEDILKTQEHMSVRKVNKSSRTKVKRSSQCASNLRATNLKNLSLNTMTLKGVSKVQHATVRRHHAIQPRLIHGRSKKRVHRSNKPRNATRYPRTSVTSRSLPKGSCQKVVYVCRQCDARCKSKFRLKMHMLLHVFDKKKNKKPVYPCAECGLQFPYKDSLKKHKMVHSWLPNVNTHLKPDTSIVKRSAF